MGLSTLFNLLTNIYRNGLTIEQIVFKSRGGKIESVVKGGVFLYTLCDEDCFLMGL